MNIIKNNPYRIIGILSNATAKEIQGRKIKITAYAKVGKQITSEFDFPLFDSIEREHDKIEKAFSAIQQSKEMLENSLFWFLNTNSFDETAINYLRNGDKEKAIEIWGKVTSDKEVTPKNYSCFNNIGTLKLLGESQGEIKEGIEQKIKLIESDYFINFVHSVAGQAYIIDNQKQIEKFIDDILKQYQGKFSSSDTLKLFSNSNGTTQKYLSKKFTEEPVHNIESQIEKTKKKRNENKINAFQFGLKLHESTKSDLTLLNSLLGVNDLKYTLTADNLAKEIMQCGIDYFNESKENDSSEEYLENALKLNNVAYSIAVGKLTKDRAKDHIATLEGMKDQVLAEAIMVLQSIKDLYLENERNIRQQIKQLEQSDYEIMIGRKTINHTAVEDNIKNSIEWQKVNEMIVDLLSDNNLKKIKECKKDEQKREFLELAEWLKDNSLKSSTITSILNKYKNIPPKLPFKILSSEITNSDKANKHLPITTPMYTKLTRFVGLKLIVECFENGNITIYKKHIGTNGSYSSNIKISPKGYTTSTKTSINTNTSVIDLPGWGSDSSCTYSIGKHRIEVYVDEYMIHSNEFIVDLAPSEKFEMELKKAQEKEKEIKQIQYYKNDILKAQNDMIKIKEWQFLRSKSDREKQINEQHSKIDIVIKNANDEKNSQLKRQEDLITNIKNKIQKAEY